MDAQKQTFMKLLESYFQDRDWELIKHDAEQLYCPDANYIHVASDLKKLLAGKREAVARCENPNQKKEGKGNFDGQNK
jgi:hypothetical protein